MPLGSNNPVADAFLLRSAFILIGATVGVIGAQSLVFLLRIRHIWYASPSASVVASIGGACIFGGVWLFLTEIGPRPAVLLTQGRRRILIGALPLFLLSAGGLVAAISLTALSPRLLWTGIFPAMLIAH